MSTEVGVGYHYVYEATKAESTDDQGCQEKGSYRIAKTNICKYKSQMCKNFSEMGFCPYRNKCQFAHGMHQLAFEAYEPKRSYRTKKCKSFWEHGVCRYGFRCQFSHYEAKQQQERDFLRIAAILLPEKQPTGVSRLHRMLEKKSE